MMHIKNIVDFYFFAAFMAVSILVIGSTAVNSYTVTYVTSDACYRKLKLPIDYNHAALFYKYAGANPMFMEMNDKCTVGMVLINESAFLNGEAFIGRYSIPGIPASARTSINSTATLVYNNYGINYTWANMIDASGSTSIIQPSQLTKLRCDGVVEYCYEYNCRFIWGKNGSNKDVSIRSYMKEHNNLGKDQPSFECSPYVQRGGAGTAYTSLRAQ